VFKSLKHRDEDGKNKKGEIHILAEEVMACRDFFNFKVKFSNLPKIGFFSPDPKVYLEIRKANESGEYIVVHRGKQVITRSPSFSVNISGQKLCNGDLDRNLKIQLYRYKVGSEIQILRAQ
jgi:hypothetical protein